MKASISNLGPHCANLLRFSNGQGSPYRDGFSLLPLLRICPHELVVSPPLVQLLHFFNVVGILHLVSIKCINFLVNNNPFINAFSTFVSFKVAHLWF